MGAQTDGGLWLAPARQGFVFAIVRREASSHVASWRPLAYPFVRTCSGKNRRKLPITSWVVDIGYSLMNLMIRFIKKVIFPLR